MRNEEGRHKFGACLADVGEIAAVYRGVNHVRILPRHGVYDFAAENGFIVNNGAMVDDGGKAVALNMAALSG